MSEEMAFIQEQKEDMIYHKQVIHEKMDRAIFRLQQDLLNLNKKLEWIITKSNEQDVVIFNHCARLDLIEKGENNE